MCPVKDVSFAVYKLSCVAESDKGFASITGNGDKHVVGGPGWSKHSSARMFALAVGKVFAVKIDEILFVRHSNTSFISLHSIAS
jgi:hypothetical protein